jgi:hypothetical protein
MIVNRTKSLIAAMLVSAVLLPLDGFGYGTAEAAATRSVTGQAAYSCQFKSAAGAGTDTVSLAMQLNVPTSVAPGEAVTLRGTLSMQFSERFRAATQALGLDSADAYSTTISTFLTEMGKSAPYFANRWQTGPTHIGNPFILKGSILFPPFSVRKDATGSLRLQMPQNGSTKNTVESSPAKVAFLGHARATGPGGDFMVDMACYFPRANQAVITTIPIATRQATTASAGSAAAPTNAPQVTTTSPATGPKTQPVAPGSQVGLAPSTGVDVPPSPGAGAVLPTEATPLGESLPESIVTRQPSGIYVSTGLLVLGGFLFCMATLGYAMLANYRLRNIRRALDS